LINSAFVPLGPETPALIGRGARHRAVCWPT